MYGYIKGIVTNITPKNIIVENNEIGYIIIVPNPYNYKLNEKYTVYTYQYVKEDIIDLYGFNTYEEKDLFLKLLSVSGIGPKSALSILASGSVKETCSAIESGNDKYLRKFPGIGQKASLQIILDLKGKLNYDESIITDSKTDDVKEALISLGYNKKEVEKVLGLLDKTLDEAKLVKEALKLLSK